MSIYDQVLAFIHNPHPEKFEPLALDVFRHQFATVDAYRRYCVSIGCSADRVTSVNHIPAVSALAFKYADLASSDALNSRQALAFLTSGTTIGSVRRGRHVVPRPEVYRSSAIAHLRSMLFPDRRRMAMLAIHPTADLMPESSLSQMISWAVEEFGSGKNLCAADRGGIDSGAAIEFLRRAEKSGEPVCILGTTAAFAALFERIVESRDSVKLAKYSRLMDTGGAKGQAVPIAQSDLIAQAADLLGINPEFVINEYGMTELCSQLYDATAFNHSGVDSMGPRIKVPPPWLRVTSVDPVGLRRVPDGMPGLLRFVDLANVGSVSAILTEDVGVVLPGGIRVLGRASAAEARGCALGLTEFGAHGDAA